MPPPPHDEYTNSLARARDLMRGQGIDALVVTDPINYGYFSGHSVPSRQKSRPSILVWALEGEPILINWAGPETLSRLYGYPHPSWIANRRIYPEVPFGRTPRVDWGIADALLDVGLRDGRVGIELGRETCLGIPVVDFELLQERLPIVEFVDAGPVVWGCRTIKSEWEIDCMRRACELGGRAWQRCFEELRPGIGALEVQKRILALYAEEGADLASEPPQVLGATGPSRTFQAGDVLYLDGGCSYQGYMMDFTRRAVFGSPSARQRDEHDGMWALLFNIIERIKPGVAVRELFEFSQQRLAARPEWRNYSDHPAKRIGHGIGLENEPPSICACDDTVLQTGMALTPEPKIESVDGLVNPEEQVVVTPTGCEILSRKSDWRLHIVG